MPLTKSEFWPPLSKKLFCLSNCRDDSIVGYKEAFFDDDTSVLCLVMEFLDDGDVYQKIVRYQKENKLF